MEHPKVFRILENRPLWRRSFWLYTAILTIALLWPNMTIPPVMPRPDLLGHYVAFGLFALLQSLWNPLGSRRQAVILLMSLATGVAYGGATELLQSIPILKCSAGWDDWGADVLGVGCGLVAFWLVQRWRGSH